MATEQALVRRERGNVVAATVKTLFDGQSTGGERTAAAVKTVGVAGLATTGGLVLSDVLLTHAAGPLQTLWADGSTGLVVTGGAIAVSVAAGIGGRVHEKDAYSPEGAERVRQNNRSFYRAVATGSLVIGGTAAVIAAGVAGAGDLGIAHISQVTDVAAKVAEAGGGLGVISAAAASYWNHRSKVKGPTALAE